MKLQPIERALRTGYKVRRSLSPLRTERKLNNEWEGTRKKRMMGNSRGQENTKPNFV